MSRDDQGREREKLTFSERDRRLRDKQKGYGAPPRSAAERERSEAATRKYVKHLEGIFAKGKGGAAGEEAAKLLRAAHGTPELAQACRAYREAVGMPADAGLLALFLDSAEPELVVAALDEMRGLQQAGGLQLSSGQRSLVRTLALASDDRIAEAAEELLGALA